MIRIQRDTLFQVNAIVIIGLLVLLTLQSLGSPIYESIVSDSFTKMFDMGIKTERINNLYDEHCRNNSESSFQFLNSTDVLNQCKKWEIEKIELEKESQAFATYLEYWSILKNNTATDSVKSTLWSTGMAKIVTMVITIPFILSTITEVFRKKEENYASTLSVAIFGSGFIILLFGIILITGMMNCSYPKPLWSCGK